MREMGIDGELLVSAGSPRAGGVHPRSTTTPRLWTCEIQSITCAVHYPLPRLLATPLRPPRRLRTAINKFANRTLGLSGGRSLTQPVPTPADFPLHD
jgi:hypothetical protein